MSECLTEDNLKKYIRHELSPEDMIKLNKHIIACDECRRRVFSSRERAVGTGILLTPMQSETSACPDYDTIAAAVDGRLGAESTMALVTHAKSCARCRKRLAELEKLKALETLPAAPRYRGIRLAAALTISVIVIASAAFYIFHESEGRQAAVPSSTIRKPDHPAPSSETDSRQIAGRSREAPPSDQQNREPGTNLVQRGEPSIPPIVALVDISGDVGRLKAVREAIDREQGVLMASADVSSDLTGRLARSVIRGSTDTKALSDAAARLPQINTDADWVVLWQITRFQPIYPTLEFQETTPHKLNVAVSVGVVTKKGEILSRTDYSETLEQVTDDETALRDYLAKSIRCEIRRALSSGDRN